MRNRSAAVGASPGPVERGGRSLGRWRVRPFQRVAAAACWRGRYASKSIPVRALSPSTPHGATPLWPVSPDRLAGWLGGEGAAYAAWVRSAGFDAAPGTRLPLPGAGGNGTVVGGVLLGVPEAPDLWAYGDCARALPPATYRIASELEPRAANAAAIGWGLGDYRFDRYRSAGGADGAPVRSLLFRQPCEEGLAELALDRLGVRAHLGGLFRPALRLLARQ